MVFFCVMRRRKMNLEIREGEDYEIPLAPEGVSGRLGDMRSVQVNDDGIGEIAFRDLIEQKLESEPTDELAYPPRPAGEVDEYEGTIALPEAAGTIVLPGAA